jgi:hypothetical protein
MAITPLKNTDDELKQDQDNELYLPVQTGMVRMSLLFGSVAIAFALLLVPFITKESARFARSSADLDYISTGSISPDNVYVEHKSVLQKNDSSVCILRSNGAKIGDC